MGINFFEQDVPDAATLLHFRHLPEEYGTGKLFFDAINRCLKRAWGNQWHFGMKRHTGMDAGSGFVHTAEATAANVHDITVAAKLLQEDDEIVCGDSAYPGLKKREEIKHNPRLSAIEYRINRRPGRLPKVSGNAIDWERYIENRKSAVRCKVEHPCRIVKNIFGFRKTVCRGLRKNLRRLHVLFAGANLYMPARAGGSLRHAWGSCSLQAGRER